MEEFVDSSEVISKAVLLKNGNKLSSILVACSNGTTWSRDSSVGRATDYGLEFESR
jgi:hypothetical protein